MRRSFHVPTSREWMASDPGRHAAIVVYSGMKIDADAAVMFTVRPLRDAQENGKGRAPRLPETG